MGMRGLRNRRACARQAPQVPSRIALGPPISNVRYRPNADIVGSVHIRSMKVAGRVLLPLLAAVPGTGVSPIAPALAAVQSPLLVAPNTQIIGITATGPRADLDRLQAFATKSGFPSQQMDSPDGWELAIAFPPGSDASAVATFIDRLRGSEYSSLQFNTVTADAVS